MCVCVFFAVGSLTSGHTHFNTRGNSTPQLEVRTVLCVVCVVCVLVTKWYYRHPSLPGVWGQLGCRGKQCWGGDHSGPENGCSTPSVETQRLQPHTSTYTSINKPAPLVMNKSCQRASLPSCDIVCYTDCDVSTISVVCVKGRGSFLVKY